MTILITSLRSLPKLHEIFPIPVFASTIHDCCSQDLRMRRERAWLLALLALMHLMSGLLAAGHQQAKLIKPVKESREGKCKINVTDIFLNFCQTIWINSTLQ